ncbi:MAG: hypothetical protein ACKER6_00155, partial [Candidatus Hodgkinia cicadicola]
MQLRMSKKEHMPNVKLICPNDLPIPHPSIMLIRIDANHQHSTEITKDWRREAPFNPNMLHLPFRFPLSSIFRLTAERSAS